MKDVQCYELFGGIALKNHAFSLFHYIACFIFTCFLVENTLKVFKFVQDDNVSRSMYYSDYCSF